MPKNRRKISRKRAVDLDLTRDQRIRDEIVAAKKKGVDAPYQIPRGEYFTVSRLSARPQSTAAGIDERVLAERDSDFVSSFETDAKSPVRKIIKGVLEQHTDTVLAQLENDIEMLNTSHSNALVTSISQRLNAVKQLKLNSRKTTALSKKLDQALYGAMKVPKSKLGGTTKR